MRKDQTNPAVLYESPVCLLQEIHLEDSFCIGGSHQGFDRPGTLSVEYLDEEDA